MGCQIKVENGNIIEVLAENGNPSNLYANIRREGFDEPNAIVEYDRIAKLLSETAEQELKRKYYNIDGGLPVDENDEPIYSFVLEEEAKIASNIAYKYEANKNGFFSPDANIVGLREEAIRIGYKVKEAASGFFYLTKNGRKTTLFREKAGNTTADIELEAKLKTVLDGLGVSVNWKENSRFAGYRGTAVADLMEKAIYMSANRHIDTLPEEAAHFYIKMLEQSGNPLYASMYNDVTRFQIYEDVKKEYADVYTTEKEFREEAIAKAISKYVVASYTGTQAELKEATRTRSWFNKVLFWFGKRMGQLGFEQPQQLVDYLGVANALLAGTDAVNVKAVQGIMYQQGKNKFHDKLLANSELVRTVTATKDMVVNSKEVKKGDSYKEINENGEWIPIKRVSDVVNEKGFGYNGPQRTDEEQVVDGNKADFGSKVHADVSELVKEETGKSPIVDERGESGFKQQLRGLVKKLIAEHPDADFYTELNVFKKKDTHGKASKLAGTIDLLVVDRDGRAHLYDFKTVNDLSVKYIDGKTYKQKWFEQLSQYKGILSAEYGITQFGQSRVIPMDVQYSDMLAAVPLSLSFGDNKLNLNKALDPIPMLDETTGDDVIDRFLNSLRDRIDNISISKKRGWEQEVASLQQSITKVLITRDVNDAREAILSDNIVYEQLFAKIVAGDLLTADEAKKIIQIQTFYIDAFEKGWVTQENGLMEDLSVMIQGRFQLVKAGIDKVLNASGVSQNDVIKPTSKTDVVNQLSNIDVPAFRAFKSMLDRTWNRIQLQLRVKKESIGELIKQIKEETGLSDESMFDSILAKDANGNKTGRLIAKRNPQWFKFYEANSSELFKNIESSPEAINYIKTTKIGRMIEDWPSFAKDVNESMQSFISTHPDAEEQYIRRVRNKIIGGKLGEFSSLINISDEFITEEYKTLMSNPDSGLAKLYQRFIATNRLAADNCDSSVKGNDLPFVRKHNIRMILESATNLRQTKDNLFDSMNTEEWQVSKTDSAGKRIYKIPLKFDKELKNRDLSQQSYDLGQVLIEWEEAVITNIEMQKMESMTSLFNYALKQQREYVTRNGEIVKNKQGEFESKDISQHTIEQFEDYVTKYLFGQNMKDDEETMFGMNRNKVVGGIMKYYSGKSLFLNVFSSIANLTGGMVSVFSTAVRNGDFSMKDVARALLQISSNNSNAWSMINLFDITGHDFKHKDLSVDWLQKNATFDKIYVLQKFGDNAVQYTTLIAYLQNMKLNKDADGNITFNKTTDQKESLLNSIKIDDKGKITIDGLDLTNEQHSLDFFKLREKIRMSVSESIGSTSEYDQFLYGNTMLSSMLMQFRRWILPMYNARVGRLKYNGTTERYSQGKYRSTGAFVQTLFSDKGMQLIRDLTNLKNSAVVDDMLRGKYEKALELNPDLDFAQFKEMYMRDLRSTMVDMIMISGVVAAKYALKSTDDDDEDSVQRILVRSLARTSAELGFWFDPESFSSILKTPIPIIGLLTDLVAIVKGLGTAGFSEVFTEEEDNKGLERAGRSVAKLTIGLNTWNSLIKEMDNND